MQAKNGTDRISPTKLLDLRTMQIGIVMISLIMAGFVFISAYANDPEIKMLSWVQHTAYKVDESTRITIQLYDAKYNLQGNTSYRGNYLNGIDVAIVILNENFDIQFIFQGKTSDDGMYVKEFIIPHYIKKGKYFVEVMSWGEHHSAYKSHVMFIDEKVINDRRSNR